MDGIVPLNELNKTRVQNLGRGFATTVVPSSIWTNETSPFALVAAKKMLATGYALDNWINTRTIQDHRLFHHGGGQFSWASAHFTQLRTSPVTYSTGLYVKPFTVNQTTGAITEGTGAFVWNNPANTTTTVSTMSWGQAGSYAFNFGDFSGPPNLTYNSGTVSAWNVVNNQVTGASYVNVGTSSAPIRCYDNFFFGTVRANGSSTAYIAPIAYTEDATPSYNDLVLSYNGSTLSTLRNNKGNAVVTTFAAGEARTHYSVSGAPQWNAGYLGSSAQGIVRYRLEGSNGYSRFDLINNSGIIANTIDTSVANGVFDRPFRGRSFDLSNGTRIVYLEDNTTLLIASNGTTVTNITAQADYIDFTRNDFGGTPYPVAQDTWIGMPDGGDRYLMKFYINPTTFKVTVLGSYYYRSVQQGQNWEGHPVWAGWFITGSNNQFSVMPHNMERSFAPTIRVYKNPLV
jgi:hypothetical protein